MTLLSWLGTVSGILGALLVALHIEASGWGFVLFLISSASWLVVGVWRLDAALAWLNVAFALCNLIGIWRWLL